MLGQIRNTECEKRPVEVWYYELVSFLPYRYNETYLLNMDDFCYNPWLGL